MKTIIFFLLTLSLGLVASCSSVKIITDFDQEADFTSYKIYAWSQVSDPFNLDYPQYDNSLNRNRWKEAIDAALQRQGYVLGEGNVDLEVDFHLQFERNAVPYHDHHDVEGQSSYNYKPTSVYQYDQGTMIIHLLDLEKKRIVWQGFSTRALDIGLLEDADANIQKAVSKIFKNFPG
ncbi:DUF4136 domain-containing protein [Neolewinella persica]|uniref:DUF4136 domain-containing protein n=1 Tax=Neolewinella persica TaxID=70998 RepID=UPI00035F61DD|nr:DUF4136 domain-containing protein [Neolewinella persica]